MKKSFLQIGFLMLAVLLSVTVKAQWANMGPDNKGSLTRAIVYDNQDNTNSTVIIATLGGSVFQTTNGGITWKMIGNENLLAGCMVQKKDGTIFIGTGDGRNSYEHNGLSEMNYSEGYRGTGIYRFVNGGFERLESTKDFNFVNDLALDSEENIYAGTDKGLFVSSDNGETWQAVQANGDDIVGNVLTVKIEQDVKLATVKYPVGSDFFTDLYYDNNEGDGWVNLEDFIGYGKVVAIAPSDPKTIYVATLDASGNSDEIFYTTDGFATEAKSALKKTALYDIFRGRGNYDYDMVVYPNNPKKVLIGGEDLWLFEDKGEGTFVPAKISDGAGGEYNVLVSDPTRLVYCHFGIQKIVFNPANVNEFYVGTEGGVYKGVFRSGAYSYSNTNRYFLTAENHVSVARTTNVGMSGMKRRVTAGNLDYGTILIYGEENMDNITTGTNIYPNQDMNAGSYGVFSYSKAGGSSAISTIDPNVIFVTAHSGAGTSPIFRTENLGADYDMSNFNFDITAENPAVIFDNGDAFRTPILLREMYDNFDTANYIYFKNTDTVAYEAGKEVIGVSKTRDRNFEFVLEEELLPGDSTKVYDPIESRLFVAIKGNLYATRDALHFNKVTNWRKQKLESSSEIPTAIAESKDGDDLWLGTAEGHLYRFSNYNEIMYDHDTVIEMIIIGEEPDLDTIYDTIITLVKSFNPEKYRFEDLTPTRQPITSIAVDPNDPNFVVVTFGGYDKETYVFQSNNARTNDATFTSIQGNLPKEPVYSSLIVEDKVYVGTVNGLWSYEVEWTKDENLAGVPVLELKQQLQENRPDIIRYVVDEAGDSLAFVSKGIDNQGMIYAATYGRGIFSNDEFWVAPVETPMAIEDIEVRDINTVDIYPNPVVGQSMININLVNKGEVNYQIYDISGRLVKNVTLGTLEAGVYSRVLDTEALSSGVYIVKLNASNETSVARVIVY